jgi:hypothetical protein
MLVYQRVYVIIPQKSSRYNVETNLWQEIRASGRAPPARSGAQVPSMARLPIQGVTDPKKDFKWK